MPIGNLAFIATMAAYSQDFAIVYDSLFSNYARAVAPFIYEFYMQADISRDHKNLLDLCCGTGQLAQYFSERGFKITGIDLSEAMLDFARRHTPSGRFIVADAADFALSAHFGLVTSTYNALNHLKDMDVLRRCFERVFAVTLPSGYFIFDLKTRKGLQNWQNPFVHETDSTFLIMRGGSKKNSDQAFTRITVFMKQDTGNYMRVNERLDNTIFDMSQVKAALKAVGWRNVYFARLSALRQPLTQPEDEDRIFIVAQKAPA